MPALLLIALVGLSLAVDILQASQADLLFTAFVLIVIGLIIRKHRRR